MRANSKQQQLQSEPFNTQQQQPPPPSFHNTDLIISHALLLAFYTVSLSSHLFNEKKKTTQLRYHALSPIKLVRAHSREILEVAIIHPRSLHSHYPILIIVIYGVLPPPSHLPFRRNMQVADLLLPHINSM